MRTSLCTLVGLFAGVLVACGADGAATTQGTGSAASTSGAGGGLGASTTGAGAAASTGSTSASAATTASSAAGVGGTGGGAASGGGDAGGSGGAGQGGDAGGGAGGGSTSSGGGVNSTPCAGGSGYALWRFIWPNNGGGYATLDAWDNGCTYSLADQACSVSGDPQDDANFGPGVIFNSSMDYFRVRFSVQGLSFSSATLHVYAHADGSGIPNGVFESPIYGSTTLVPTVPISTHRHYAVDWTDFLSPSDPPSLTAVTLESMPTGLAVTSLELCVE